MKQGTILLANRHEMIIFFAYTYIIYSVRPFVSWNNLDRGKTHIEISSLLVLQLEFCYTVRKYLGAGLA